MRILFLMIGVFGISLLPAQTMREIILPFNDDQCQFFESDVQRVIDSVYYNMREGEKVRLCMYTRYERKTRTQAQLQVLAAKRASLVNAYLTAKKTLPASEINTVVPFDYSLPETNRALTDYLSPDLEKPMPGITAVILVKNEPFQRFYTHLNDSVIPHRKQEIILNRTNFNRIYTNGGLELSFQPHSFVLENGAQHGCDQIKIVLEEYLNLPDMLVADLTTHSNGKMLESGGMIYIEAWCGNQKLKLAPGKYFEVLFPAYEKKEGMKTFNGRKSPYMSDWIVQKGGEVKRSPEDFVSQNSNNESNLFIDEEGGYLDGISEEVYNMTDGYLLKSMNLGWINCDRFYEIEDKTELLVSCDAKEQICYRLVFRDIKSIMPAYDCGTDGTFKFDGIPAGERVVLLAYYISKDKKTGLFAAKELTLGQTKSEKLQLQNVDPLTIQNQFADLFPN